MLMTDSSDRNVISLIIRRYYSRNMSLKNRVQK